MKAQYLRRGIAGLIIVVMAVLYFSSRCNSLGYSDSVIDLLNNEAKAKYSAVQDSLILYDKYNDSLSSTIATKDSIIRILAFTAKTKDAELNKSKSTVLQLRNELRDYRDRDTGWVYTKLDTLLLQIDSLVARASALQLANDSLQSASYSQQFNYQTLATERAILLQQIRLSYDGLYNINQRIIAEHNVGVKNLRREKLKTKIAIAIALVEGILLALK